MTLEVRIRQNAPFEDTVEVIDTECHWRNPIWSKTYGPWTDGPLRATVAKDAIQDFLASLPIEVADRI